MVFSLCWAEGHLLQTVARRAGAGGATYRAELSFLQLYLVPGLVLAMEPLTLQKIPWPH